MIRMNPSRSHLAWIARAATVAGLAFASVITAACGSGRADATATPAETTRADADAPKDASQTMVVLSAEAVRTGGIVIAPAATESRAGSFETPAVLALDDTRTARIGSIVDGAIVDATVQVGVMVRKGAVLASIHSHMVHEAWAEYRRAMAERRRATGELTFVKDAEGRATRLLAAKAVSQHEADRARTDRAAAEEALVIANSEVTRALDELEHLGIEPVDGVVTETRETVPVSAPIGGTVLERLVTAGTAVTTGAPLFVVSDLSRLWAIAEVDESRLPMLSAGRTAELTVAAYPDRPFTARVIAVGDTINPETRRVTVRLEVDNRDGHLKPHMFATVRIASMDSQEVVVIPSAAVQSLNQRSVVFVEQAAGRFAARDVEIGTERGGRVEIRSGVKVGERIVTTGAFLLKSKVLEGAQPE